ncbi:3528_t:CDS:1, partial [Racocetra persica]
KLEKESKIPFRLLRILQTTFVSLQLLLQIQGVTKSKYKLHETVITTEERLQQGQIFNRAHVTRNEIEIAENLKQKIFNNSRYYRNTEEDEREDIENLTLERKYIYQEIFHRNIGHEDAYEEYQNKTKRKEPKIKEISTQYNLNDLNESNLYYTTIQSKEKPIYIPRRNN